MYPVSDAYKNIISSGAIEFDVYGTIGSTDITAANIMALSITNQCSSESEVRIGQVYVGQLTMTIVGTSFTARTLIGLPVVLYAGPKTDVPVGLLTDGSDNVVSNENGAWLVTAINHTPEYVPLGVYYIDSAMWTMSGIEITAYDTMAKFDVTVASPLTGTPYSILSACCTACGVTFGMTQAQVEALPNGTFNASCYGTNDITVYRDIISWVAQMMGCYATINRGGRLVLRTYITTPIESIDSTRRFMGGSFSDYITFYTAMTVTDIETNEDTRYALATDDGLTYTLGPNPYLQAFADDTEKATVLNALLTAITAFQYVPFTTELAPDPRYDLGDVLLFTGGIADNTVLYCINKFEWTYNHRIVLTGVGRNAAYKDQTASPVHGIALATQSAADANQAAADASQAADDASKVATDYITDVTVGGEDGIEVTGNGASSKVQITDTVKVIADATHFAEMTDSQFKIHSGNALYPSSYMGTADAAFAGDGQGHYLVRVFTYNPDQYTTGGALELRNADGNVRVRLDAFGDYGSERFFNADGNYMVSIGTSGDGSYGALQLYRTVTGQSLSFSKMAELGKVIGSAYINQGEAALLVWDTSGHLTGAYGGGAAYIYASSSFAGYVAHGKTISHRLTYDFDTIGGYNYLRFWIDGSEVYRLQQQSYSDRRVKEDIEPINSGYKKAVAAVDLSQFRFDFNDEVRQGGNGIMFGIIAQDLIDKLADNGIDFERTPLVADLDNEEESLYSVDYVQFLLARLAADEDRIGELEEKIEERKQA